MGRRAEGDPDRPAGIYAAVISALIAGGRANYDPWPPVTYIDATARSSAGPVAVSDVVTSPIPIDVEHQRAKHWPRTRRCVSWTSLSR